MTLHIEEPAPRDSGPADVETVVWSENGDTRDWWESVMSRCTSYVPPRDRRRRTPRAAPDRS
ncbi:hypothetical protein [Rhodococcoides corynebacterioides]|uniref:Uncharacterized protein n=1 Tax=Rhodococcoides corynebacterioides TaxID=53972 RepID=A0ABS7NZH2_9NOCA|nr:hypothetical protein [Rhodococcus corynebacterioides]MBY6365539.1 hypothetical protein [Rhodococcus corynebacterioides]MBY6408605.1 hypothetical protein [Rhodococcus corynebacterioides]